MDDRFHELAFLKLSERASEEECLELDSLLSENAELKAEYEQLKMEIPAINELMLVTEAVETSGEAMPDHVKTALMEEIDQNLDNKKQDTLEDDSTQDEAPPIPIFWRWRFGLATLTLIVAAIPLWKLYDAHLALDGQNRSLAGQLESLGKELAESKGKELKAQNLFKQAEEERIALIQEARALTVEEPDAAKVNSTLKELQASGLRQARNLEALVANIKTTLTAFKQVSKSNAAKVEAFDQLIGELKSRAASNDKFYININEAFKLSRERQMRWEQKAADETNDVNRELYYKLAKAEHDNAMRTAKYLNIFFAVESSLLEKVKSAEKDKEFFVDMIEAKELKLAEKVLEEVTISMDEIITEYIRSAEKFNELSNYSEQN